MNIPMDLPIIPMRFTLRKIAKNILTSELYKRYERCIKKEAWKAHLKTGIDYDELFSRGNLLFCEATKTWNKDKGAFITHLVWRLQTLKQVGKELYSPSTDGQTKNFWCSLEAAMVDSDGDSVNSDPYEACCTYSKKMEETCEDSSWEERLPDFRRYMDMMNEDERQMCNDILDGYFEVSEVTGKGMSETNRIAHVTNIPMMRLYAKRYVKLGWTKSRTQCALDNLRQMCRRWTNHKAPVRAILVKNIEIPELF